MGNRKIGSSIGSGDGKGSDWRGKRKLRGKPFRCKLLAKEVGEYECGDNYVNDTSKQKRDSPCFECPQGRENRDRLAGFADDPELKQVKNRERDRGGR